MILEYATPTQAEHCPLAELACKLGIVSGFLSVGLALVVGWCLNACALSGEAWFLVWLGAIFLPEICVAILAVTALVRIGRRGMRGLYLASLGLVTSLLWLGAELWLLWKLATY
jgi:hypothetical protein